MTIQSSLAESNNQIHVFLFVITHADIHIIVIILLYLSLHFLYIVRFLVVSFPGRSHSFRVTLKMWERPGDEAKVLA